MTASRPPKPILGYSALTGTVYVLKRNGQKEAVPTDQLVTVIAGWLDDHDLIVKKDGFRVKYGVEEILPLEDDSAAPRAE
jgi:hypothetical protein